MLTCRSSTVMTYKYMRSPCIFRLPGGGFQPLIVNTFRHCKGYRRTQQKQLLSAGSNSLELEPFRVHGRFLSPAALTWLQNKSSQTPGLGSRTFCEPCAVTNWPQFAALHIVRPVKTDTLGLWTAQGMDFLLYWFSNGSF